MMTIEMPEDTRDLLWWESYGLQEHPFDAVAEQSYLFLPTTWLQNLTRLQQLHLQGQQLIVVQGPAGVGKTTLVEQFIEQLDHSIPLCHLLGSEELSTEELIEVLCGCFNLDIDLNEAASVRELLNQILFAMNKYQRRGILIIDKVELLKTPIIQALAYLQTERQHHQTPLTIILILNTHFQSQFEQIVTQYLTESEIALILVEPLSYQEMQQYLTQRLRAAGMPGSLPLQEAELLKIQQQTLGVPFKINHATETLLLGKLQTYPAATSTSFAKTRLIANLNKNVILGALSMILLSTAFFYWWQHNLNTNLYDEPRHLLSKNVKTLAPALITTAANTTELSNSKTSNMSNNMPNNMLPINNTPKPAVITPAKNLGANQQPASVSAVTKTTLPLLTRPNNSLAMNSMMERQPLSLDKQELIQTVGAQVASMMVRSTQVTHPAVPVVAKTALSVRQPMVRLKEKPTKIDKEMNSTLHLAMSSPLHTAGFTIQLMGARHLQDLQRYRRRAELNHWPVSYFKTQFNGKDWYVLIYGYYPTSSVAKAALNDVPVALREKTTSPWIRSIKSVHTAIAIG